MDSLAHAGTSDYQYHHTSFAWCFKRVAGCVCIDHAGRYLLEFVAKEALLGTASFKHYIIQLTRQPNRREFLARFGCFLYSVKKGSLTP